MEIFEFNFTYMRVKLSFKVRKYVISDFKSFINKIQIIVIKAHCFIVEYKLICKLCTESESILLTVILI